MHRFIVGGTLALFLTALLVAITALQSIRGRAVAATKTKVLVLLHAAQKPVPGAELLGAIGNRHVLREALTQLFVEGCVIWPERNPSLLMRRFQITEFGIECLNEDLSAMIKPARRT